MQHDDDRKLCEPSADGGDHPPRHADQPWVPALTATEWDARYAGEQVWSGEPNATLVAELADLEPGRALDVGCGEGADAIWLARAGWTVTALDISAVAVERMLAAAEVAGVSVTGVAAPLLAADLSGGYDLVSAMYPVLAVTEDEPAERCLAELVAPGGTLLLVHHEPDDQHAPPTVELLGPRRMGDFLRRSGGWRVTEGRRARHVRSGPGARHHVDLVLRARRDD